MHQLLLLVVLVEFEDDAHGKKPKTKPSFLNDTIEKEVLEVIDIFWYLTLFTHRCLVCKYTQIFWQSVRIYSAIGGTANSGPIRNTFGTEYDCGV